MNIHLNQNNQELTPLGATQSTELILYRALHSFSGALTHLGVKFVVTGDYVGYEHGFYKVPRSLMIVLLSDSKGNAADVDQVQKSICGLASDGVNIFSSEKRGKIRFNDTLPSQYVTHTSCRINLIVYHDAHTDVQTAYSNSRLVVSKNGPWRTTPPILNVLDSLGMFPKDGHLKRQGQKVIQRLRYMIRQVLPGDPKDEVFISNNHFRTIRRISDHISEAYSYAPLKKYLDIRPRVATGHEGLALNAPICVGSGSVVFPSSSRKIEDNDDAVLSELAKKLCISPNSFS
ncbi:hypothetical protein BJ165DRAFT_753697 [Panaeolus papilionaceus]|nr:hypothetical protein BJ165DRAFT_753697 [Panaeolus papilionaceus]